MTDFVRIPGKVFAENASGIGNNPEIGQFGSAKAGTFVGTDDVRTIQDLEAWSQGWTSAVVSSNNYPPLPEMNGVLKVLSYQMCYLLQHGIPEWSSETTYYTNDYVNYNGALYFSTIDNNTTEPTTAQGGNNWKSGTVELPIATTTRIGAVQPDGVSIGITPQGVISILPSPIIDISHPIGDPILTLNNTLNNNEIWLEGASVSKTTYSKLFAIYGTTYGTSTTTNFTLPDFRNRALWGANTFGYISAGLPQHTHSPIYLQGSNADDGDPGRLVLVTSGQNNGNWDINSSSTGNVVETNIYGQSTTVQPPAIRIRVKTRYQ